MRLSFQTAQLKAAYAAAAAAIPTRTTKDILKCVLLQSTQHGCRLIGGDSDLIVSASLPAQEQLGEILLPTVLGQILRETVAETIELVASEGRLIVNASGSRFTLTTGDAAEYPPPPEPAGESRSILGGTLAAAIDATIHAVDNESTRYALACVAIDGDSVVATDARRLAIYSLPEAITTQQIKVPAKAANILRRAFATLDHVEIRTDGNTATFATDTLSVYCRLLEGRFPKWQAVIPSDWQITTSVSVGDLLRAVRLTAATTDKDDLSVTLAITPEAIRLRSSGTSGEGEQDVACHSDGVVTLRVGAHYLAQALTTFPADHVVTIRAIDADTAIMLDLACVRQIIMPLSTPD